MVLSVGISSGVNSVGSCPVIQRVTTHEQAHAIAPLYCAYYQRVALTIEDFVEKWSVAQHDPRYYFLAAYQGIDQKPCGFIDFSIIPSIFWAPCVARIDSFYVMDAVEVESIAQTLFEQALEIMDRHKISKIIAVSCDKYEREASLLSQVMSKDDKPTKHFFVRLGTSESGC